MIDMYSRCPTTVVRILSSMRGSHKISKIGSTIKLSKQNIWLELQNQLDAKKNIIMIKVCMTSSFYLGIRLFGKSSNPGPDFP